MALNTGPKDPSLLLPGPPDTTMVFSIGKKRATNGPLVSVAQVKGHLALLHAFQGLKHALEYQQEDPDTLPDMPGDKAKRWAWFVHVAVER